MKIGFYTVFRKDPVHYVLADILVASARAVMPDVPVVHLTDERSPAVLDVDAVTRKPDGRMLERRMEHYAACEGDWLLVDTDIVLAKDVQHVFEDPAFDIAISDREWSLVKDHYKYTREMPYNTGAVFTRTPAFYARVLEMWRGYPAEKQGHWWSEQWAVADVAFSGAFRVKILPGMVYNRPPATYDEDLSDAAILHYKGPERKLWMIQRHCPKQGYENAVKLKAAG